MRLLDARNGNPTEVRPASRGLLRMRADLPANAPPPDQDITGLRVLLVADLLTRTAEMRNMQAITVLATTHDDTGDLGQLAGALGIHPPAGQASDADVEKLLGGPADVRVIASQDGQDGQVGQDGLVAFVGAARMSQPPAREPLAIRLVLLSSPYYEPADVTEAALATAHDTLGRWRKEVARWAESPSKAIPADLARRLRIAIDDLDTVSMLAFLDDLAADAGVPPGVKLESFAFADRVLAVDLARDIGKA